MDTAAALSAFDRQLRRELPPGDDATTVERELRLIRHVSTAAHSWQGVVWTDLDEATADAAIAAELPRITGDYEWKYYSHDQPADLPDRLVAAGLVPDDLEAVLVAEAAEVPDFAPPAGVEIVDATTPAGISQATELHQRVFDKDMTKLRAQLLAAAPGTLDVVLAVADGEVVCAARTDYYVGTDFAGLWGGGTLPEWRGKGVYKAVVSHRARRAQARGFRYLQVDALPTSEPILRRAGFTRLTSTRPFTRT
ncbi:putative acetyltransferase [Alloactinosynnema sp. L-07]|uniref:GNAT family N-acetyltransferase n=1 Tax=Alloactinosynnema sp. L-07 TaxID=1653480 RepID=UPI00065EF4AF|nr:GNAT family N-acetyltransferase [Alloactinosynnema sp. L-07]CRK56177.1 putative acetyltransferase [Alloactinosynnema sp. L-07]